MPSQNIAELRRQLAEAEAAASRESEQEQGPAVPQDHRPAGLVPTTAKGWKNKLGTPQPLELPSGNVCLVKRPGLPQLLKDGILPDVMTPLAEQAIKAVDKDEADSAIDDSLKGIMARPDGMETMFEAVERVAAHVVVEPIVHYSKRKVEAGQADQMQESYKPAWELIPEADRDPDILYTDQVDMNDLMFIFQFVVGGSRDLESFRQQTR
jgi:hypothetical protein